MKERIKVGICGLGGRGREHMKHVLRFFPYVDVVGLCDVYEDRIERAMQEGKEIRPELENALCSQDYHDIINIPGLDAVLITSSWQTHLEIAIAAMRAGVRPGLEVGGAYSMEELWRLVYTSEDTGVPCMLLENCCYGREEMALINMVREGIFGELVHLEGGYHHDLREEVVYGREKRHYRIHNYMYRNCENYPTHELGPIAQMLNINHGNRMLTLNSVATSSRGLNAFLRENKGPDYDLTYYPFAQGDVVTTIIKCAGGQTITLSLDTNTPKAYSRGLRVQGTKGTYIEDNQSVFIEGINNEREIHWREEWGNMKNFCEQYEHPIWDEFRKSDITAGHGGMDYLVQRAFFESVMNETDPPIDVYDTAAWMCISALSEQSIAMGGAPVAIPDFTNGKWLTR